MSDRVRHLLVATALTVAVAAVLWILGVEPHAVATAEGGDRVIAHRSVPGAGKASPRVLVAAAAAAAALGATAAVVTTRAALPGNAARATARLYALLHVYRL